MYLNLLAMEAIPLAKNALGECEVGALLVQTLCVVGLMLGVSVAMSRRYGQLAL